MIRVAIAGANGRMGREAVAAVSAESDMELVAKIVRGDSLRNALASSRPDVLVDLTTPEFVFANALACLDAGVRPVIGATGLSPEQVETLSDACANLSLGGLIAPNFAIGALLMMRFAADAARYFPDVEIVEMHHEKKVDAPSGTALKTARMIADARVGTPISAPAGAFQSAPGARGGKGAGDIPVHSIRLPGYVASQEVVFGGSGQRLSLRHDSLDRASFMPGVLLAVRKVVDLTTLIHGLENVL